MSPTQHAVDILRPVVMGALPPEWQLKDISAEVVPPGRVTRAIFKLSANTSSVQICFYVRPNDCLCGLRIERRDGNALDWRLIHRRSLAIRLDASAVSELLSELSTMLTQASSEDSLRPSKDVVERELAAAMVRTAMRRMDGSSRHRFSRVPHEADMVIIANCPVGLSGTVAQVLGGLLGMSVKQTYQFGSVECTGFGLTHVDIKPDRNIEPHQGSLIPNLLSGGCSVVVTVPFGASLPSSLREVSAIHITLPPLGKTEIVAALRRIYGRRIRLSRQLVADARRLEFLTPLDFIRALVSSDTPRCALRRLGQFTRDRLAQQNPASMTPKLSDLPGLGEVQRHFLDLVRDLAAAQAGNLPFSQLPRGFLLAGPPGTGKTSLVRAVAAEVSCQFILLSPAALQAVDHLGHHLRAIRKAFARARSAAPALLFIDEADSFGHREQVGGNSYYRNAVINCLLEELQGYEASNGVVVIAATNRPEAIDPALRRSGRLDRTLFIDLPDHAALAEIWDYYLKQAGLRTGHGEQLATWTMGCSGADVERMVREASVRGRRFGRAQPSLEDVVAIVRDTPEPGDRTLSEDLRVVAAHEAGHALVQVVEFGLESLAFVSVLPRSGGRAGLTAWSPKSSALTAIDMSRQLHVLLAGRAAESLLLGPDRVTAGAGLGPDSDLARATELVVRMETNYGFSASGALVWTTGRDPKYGPFDRLLLDQELQRAVNARLLEAYDAVVATLKRHEAGLRALQAALLNERELDGPQVRALMASTTLDPSI